MLVIIWLRRETLKKEKGTPYILAWNLLCKYEKFLTIWQFGPNLCSQRQRDSCSCSSPYLQLCRCFRLDCKGLTCLRFKLQEAHVSPPTAHQLHNQK